MKLWIKIILAVFIVLAVIFTAAHIFIAIKGRSILKEKLETLTKRKVTIGYFHLSPPFTFEIKNLDIEGLAKVESIFVTPNLPFLLTGAIALNDIIITKPEFTFERSLYKTEDLEAMSAQGEAVAISTQGQKKKRLLRLICKNLNIKNGRLNFHDYTTGPEGIKITVKDINFKLSNLYVFPLSVITNFELKGKLPWREGEREGSVEAEGWINLFKKDMQAALQIEGIDGVYLYPYYSNWVDLEKARIESAKLNFTSNIHGLNNNVTAQCHLELTDIVRRPRLAEEEITKAEKITDAVLDIFRTLNQGKIVLDFTIRTKMDRPEFGFSDIKTAFEDRLAQAKKSTGFDAQEVLMLPARLLESAVKTTTDLSKAIIDGTFAVGNELKRTVEEAFKKEEKE